MYNAICVRGQGCELCQDVGQLHGHMRSIQVCRFIFDHFPFCDAWQWVFLATSMCQRADPRCQWTAHVYTESCRITTCRLQGATIAIPSRSGSQTNKNLKEFNNSTTCKWRATMVEQWPNHCHISPPSMHALAPGQWLLAYD